jgi:hypothetical protein
LLESYSRCPKKNIIELGNSVGKGGLIIWIHLKSSNFSCYLVVNGQNKRTCMWSGC